MSEAIAERKTYGWDQGQAQQRKCWICGSVMEAAYQRPGKYTPGGWDYKCAKSNDSHHMHQSGVKETIRRLKVERDATASTKLKAIFDEEIQELLKTLQSPKF
jgi:hypothetical protein